MDVSGNPYVGPRSFTTRERNRFFGRDREARELLSKVISERLVLFYAQSGAGKSSLINARLLPQVKEEGFLVLPVGRVSGNLPEGVQQVDNIFIYNLLVSLDQSRKDPGRFASLTLSVFLENLVTTDGEHYYYEAGTPEEEEETGQEEEYQEPAHLLIIDQFEEIFTTHLEHWEQRAGFFEQLDRAMEDDPLLWVVLVLREDYVAALDPFTSTMRNRMRARQYMQRMGYASALEAVRKPAEQAGRPFDKGVAEELVNNLRLVKGTQDGDAGQDMIVGEFIEPVQLQVVCYQLWENLKGESSDCITQEDLWKLARGSDLASFINRALGEFYEQAVARVVREKNVSERRVRDWFSEKLITEAETRGYVYQGEKTTGGLPNEAVQLLQEQYIIRSEPKAGGTWIELVHDRFIGPILRSNRDWQARHQNPLVLDAEVWRESDRNPGKLYEGAQLRRALAQAKEHPEELTELAEEFLRESEEAAQRKAAVRQRRLLAGAGVLVVVLAFLTILATANSIRAGQSEQNALAQQATAEGQARARATQEAIAITQRAIAEAQQATAEAASIVAVQQQAIAEAASTEALEQRETAVAAAEEASAQRNIAVSRQLAAQANSFINSQPDLTALLGIEAFNTSDTVEAKSVLLSVLQRSLGQSFQEFGRPIPVQPTDIYSVAFSPDASRLAWASADGTINLWNMQEQIVERRLSGHFQAVVSLAFSPDGNTLASGGFDSDIILWDLNSGGFLTLRNVNTVFSLSFNEDGRRLAAAVGTIVVVWDVTNWQTRQPIREDFRGGHNNTVRSVAWAPDGNLVASGAEDRRVILWDPATGEQVQNYRQQEDQIYGVAWSPDSRKLASAGVDGTILLWDVQLGREVRPPIPISDQALRTIAYNSKGDLLVVGGDDNAITLLDAVTLDVIARLEGFHERPVRSLAFSPRSGQNLLASGSFDNSVGLFQIITEQPLSETLIDRSGPLTGLAQDPEGPVLAAERVADGVDVWSVQEGETQVGAAPVEASAAALSPDGRLLALGDAQGGITLWDIEGSQAQNFLETSDAPITSLAFHPDETRLAFSQCLEETEDQPEEPMTCLKGQIAFWDLTSEEVAVLWENSAPEVQQSLVEGHTDYVFALAFNQDGTILASGGQDKSIIIWNVESRQPIGLPLSQHQATVTSLAFSPLGDTLASGSLDQQLILWDIDTRRPLGEPITGTPGGVTSLRFNTNGDGLYAGSEIGTLLRWDVGFSSWVRRACRLAGRNMTQAEWSQYIPDRDYQETCNPALFSGG